jgi:hypothetical protein
LVEAAGSEPLRSRDYIQADGAAEAAVLKNRGFPLKELAVPVNPPQHERPVQEVVEDYRRVAVGAAKPGSSRVAAMGV